MGDGTTTNRTTPVQVSGLSGVTAIAGGSGHTIALKSDGTVWAWGWNEYGQLGNVTTTTTNSTTPVRVGGLSLSDVTAIAVGIEHSIALKSDETIWAWGRNEYGQLGDGTTTDRYSPVQLNSNRASATDVITGNIMDAITFTGIAGATVSTDTGGFLTTTEADGSYILEVAPESYTLTASATGYTSNVKSVTVVEDEKAQADFLLQPTTIPGNVTEIWYGWYLLKHKKKSVWHFEEGEIKLYLTKPIYNTFAKRFKGTYTTFETNDGEEINETNRRRGKVKGVWNENKNKITITFTQTYPCKTKYKGKAKITQYDDLRFIENVKIEDCKGAYFISFSCSVED